MEKAENIKKVENNLRLIITIAIFFLAILSDARIEGSILIVVYLLTYIAVQTLDVSYTEQESSWMNRTLLTGLFVYTVVFIFLILDTQKIVVPETIAWGSVRMLMVLPFSTLCLALFPIWRMYLAFLKGD